MSYLSAKAKIRARAVCKKWFNELNSEKTWENMCKERKFAKITRFCWLQSYFLQARNAVVRKTTPFSTEFLMPHISKYEQFNIARVFPHPLFLDILHLCPFYGYEMGNTVALYPPQELADFMNRTVFPISSFDQWYSIIKEKKWDKNVALAHCFLKFFLEWYFIMTNATLDLLYNTHKCELLDNLMLLFTAPSLFCNTIYEPKVKFMESFMQILNKEEKLYSLWKSWLMKQPDSVWATQSIIHLIIERHIKVDKAIPLLSEKLQTAKLKVVVQQTLGALEKFISGTPASKRNHLVFPLLFL
jgi:hypothetical protein